MTMKRENILEGIEIIRRITARKDSLKRLSTMDPRLVTFENNVLDDIDLPINLREIFGDLAAAQLKREINELEDQLEAL